MSALRAAVREDLVGLWPVNHCVPLAIAVLGGLTPERIQEIARSARTITAPETRETFGIAYALLNASGGSYVWSKQQRRLWFDPAGLREIETAHYRPRDPRPTLARFAREHPEGLYFLTVRDYTHAIALVDGVVYWGTSRTRDLGRVTVCRATRVERV